MPVLLPGSQVQCGRQGRVGLQGVRQEPRRVHHERRNVESLEEPDKRAGKSIDRTHLAFHAFLKMTMHLLSLFDVINV